MSGYRHALLVKIVPNFFTYAASNICEITAPVYAPAALAIKFTSSDFAFCSLKAVRGYIPRSRNIFSVTKEGFVGGTAPTKGAKVGIGTGGKIDAAGTGFGTCVDVEVAGRYTYYAIKIGKTETTAASTPSVGG